MALVGLAMVVISGFYLIEYARSGSDADDFNVVAAPPEEYLELVGQSIPNPGARDAAAETMRRGHEPASGTSSSVNHIESFNPGSETLLAETVSIASVLPGVGSASRQEDASASLKALAGSDGAALDGHVSTLLAPSADRENPQAGSVPEASLPSSNLLVETFASIYPGGNMNPALLVRTALGG